MSLRTQTMIRHIFTHRQLPAPAKLEGRLSLHWQYRDETLLFQNLFRVFYLESYPEVYFASVNVSCLTKFSQRCCGSIAG